MAHKKTAYSPRCSICTHKYADTIADLLARRAKGEEGMTLKYIVQRMEELGEPVTECALSRHASNHFNVVEEARAKVAKIRKEAVDDVAAEMLTDMEFLDKVKARTAELMDDDAITPGVGDALRAIEIKHKVLLKDADPLEELMGAIAESAGADG